MKNTNFRPEKGLLYLLLCLFTALDGPVLATEAPPLPAYSTEYSPARNPFQDGAAAIKLASQSNRRILIELGGTWCSWCHKMDAFFDQNPDIRQKLHQTFVMLKVNVSDENDNAEFLKAFPRPSGYPHMYVAEPNGNLIYSKDTAEFVVNGQYSRESFLSFFDRWQLKTNAAGTQANYTP